MQDVATAIKGALEEVKDFARESLNNLTLKYLGAVVDREYLAVGMSEIANTPEETIRSVLNRIHESILTREHKDHLFSVIDSARTNSEPDEHTKIICHYFSKLLVFQNALEKKERNISDFCELCSAYIVDKQFVYDNTIFGFDIRPLPNAEDVPGIELSDLSSGEKQIVSLFVRSRLIMRFSDEQFRSVDVPLFHGRHG